MFREDTDALMGQGYWTRSNSEPVSTGDAGLTEAPSRRCPPRHHRASAAKAFPQARLRTCADRAGQLEWAVPGIVRAPVAPRLGDLGE